MLAGQLSTNALLAGDFRPEPTKRCPLPPREPAHPEPVPCSCLVPPRNIALALAAFWPTSGQLERVPRAGGPAPSPLSDLISSALLPWTYHGPTQGVQLQPLLYPVPPPLVTSASPDLRGEPPGRRPSLTWSFHTGGRGPVRLGHPNQG